MAAERTVARELTERGSGDRPFQVGDACKLRYSDSCRRYSLKHGVITGELGMYKYYDDFGECQGERLSYRVSVDGVEVCAPPEMVMPR